MLQVEKALNRILVTDIGAIGVIYYKILGSTQKLKVKIRGKGKSLLILEFGDIILLVLRDRDSLGNIFYLFLNQ